MKLRAIILGCGSSGGVPRIGGEGGRGDWGACDPTNPKNRRTRCSLVVQRANEEGTFEGPLTTLLIDTSPDMREQLLSNHIPSVDAVFLTHDHADQTHGIDDLRVIAIRNMARVPVYFSEQTCPNLLKRFDYCFEQQPGSSYPAVLDHKRLPHEGDEVLVDGPTGPIPVMPFLQTHGRVPSHGFRFGGLVYSPDLDGLHEESWELIGQPDVWIIDALQYKPHGSHLHLDKTLEYLERTGSKRGVLTNLHVVMDYETLASRTPEHVTPAFDGMSLVIEEPEEAEEL